MEEFPIFISYSRKDMRQVLPIRTSVEETVGCKCWMDLKATFIGASPVAQLVKNLPAMSETWVQSRSWEEPLEKEQATRSSILAWRIPWTV